MKKTPFNLKTILTGSLLGIPMTVISMYSVNIVHGDYMAEDHLSAGGVFVFFVMCACVNPVLKLVTRNRICYTSAELLVIYVMLFSFWSLAEVGLCCAFYPILAGCAYYSTAQNGWAEAVLPHAKDWLMPKDMTKVTDFFEGVELQQQASWWEYWTQIPWLYWIRFFVPWALFLMALYITSMCLMSVLRKQWVEREKVQFPLNNVPLSMTAGTDGNIIGSLFRNRLMWLGFGIAFLISLSLALHANFPFIPSIKLFRTIPFFRRSTSLVLAISVPTIGIMYFVNARLSFSLWFFALFFKVLEGSFNILGISSSEKLGSGSFNAVGGPIISHLCFGALVAYVGQSLWFARDHLKTVCRHALGRGADADDSSEILSYRASFWGTVLGMLVMTAWLLAAGMSLHIILLFLFLMFVVIIGLTKAICQGGLISLKAPSIASGQVVSMLGSDSLNSATMTNLGLSYIYHSDLRNFPMVPQAHAGKLGEKIAKGIRPLCWTIMLALLIEMVLANLLVVKLAYQYGGINLNGWYFQAIAKFPWEFAGHHLQYPHQLVFSGIAYKVIGFVIMVLLMFLHYQFLWWPLHPLGFPIASTYRILFPMLSIFIGWLMNVALMRLGGPRVYDRFKPFFLGLVLGTFVTSGVCFLISFTFGIEGMSTFYT